jgi:hypothetical protein
MIKILLLISSLLSIIDCHGSMYGPPSRSKAKILFKIQKRLRILTYLIKNSIFDIF